MLSQFLVGGIASLLNIAIHAVVMLLVVRVAQGAGAKVRRHPSLLLVEVMIATVFVLMLTHTLEAVVWAFAYSLVGATPQGASHLYLALVNYATLGYGDIIPVPRWQLLGPLTAMNGMLLFGWSAAVIFEVLRRTLARLDILPEE